MNSSSEKTPLLVHFSIGRNSSSIDSSGSIGEQREIEDNQRKGLQPSLDMTVPDSTVGPVGITNMTVIALAFTVFVQSYLLEGVFPYAGFLTMHLLSLEKTKSAELDVNEETVGKYAGYVACSFMAGRAITAVLWGRIADAYGRIFVLEVSLVTSAITSLGFGFASTYREALIWRFLMGVGNGITGTIKCLLSEIKESSGSEEKETKTMAIVYGMRGYGFLLCPAITGFLSDPIKQYPIAMSSTRIPSSVKSVLQAYPFVLPNLLAFFLCWGAFRLVRTNVEETLPEERRQPLSLFQVSLSGIQLGPARGTKVLESEAKGLVLPVGVETKIEASISDRDALQNAGANGTTTAELLWYSSDKSRNGTNAQSVQQRRIRGRWFHLYVYWMFSFLNIAADEMFPLFCLSKLSGLSLMENQISLVLGGTTIAYGFFQYILLTGLVKKVGLYTTLRIGTFGSIPPAILIPLGSLWLVTVTNVDNDTVIDTYSDDGDNGDDLNRSKKLSPLVALYLCTMIAATKSFCSVAFSTITMAINRTVDTIEQRATLNGIVSLGGSFAKACGPVFAGNLFSVFAGEDAVVQKYAIGPPYGSFVAYGILSMLGLVLGVQSLFLKSNSSSS